jgi:hypothetical protein
VKLGTGGSKGSKLFVSTSDLLLPDVYGATLYEMNQDFNNEVIPVKRDNVMTSAYLLSLHRNCPGH